MKSINKNECQKKNKMLFILKKRNNYGDLPGVYGYSISSGLFNSANFMKTMMEENGYETKIVEVVDNNGIDKEVHLFKPDYVIIEALWVVPEKFEVLHKLHPNVKWIIRIHSETPFLSNEGVGIGWISEYPKYDNVYLSFNSKRTNKEFTEILSEKMGKNVSDRVIYLPNYYKLEPSEEKCCSDVCKNTDEIHIGCFGAIRPMKNQLLQAIAAMRFGNLMKKKVFFHINSKRIENKGDNVLKNLKNLFNGSKHELVEHDWLDRKDFLELLSKMDIGLQVSFSETFNIVTADMVSKDVPVVVSKEVEWMFPLFYANTTSSKAMVVKMFIAWITGKIGMQKINRLGLMISAKHAKDTWLGYFNRFL